MAKKSKTFREIKRDNSKMQCYCYYCIGSKKFEILNNRELVKIEIRKEVNNIIKDVDYEFNTNNPFKYIK